MEGFHIINKLGEGAYSTVLKVTRAEDGNTYALKKVKLLKLNEKEKLNALNEVRILASVKSNFVISYKTHPKLHTSLLLSYGLSFHTSGLA